MLCQLCNKNEATIHLTEIVNDKMVDLHICELCAKEKSVDISLPLAFKDVLSGLVDFTGIEESAKSKNTNVCKQCGISYDEFKEKGRLGCAKCYLNFQDELLPLIKNVHGANHHFGKRPISFEEEYKIDNELNDLSTKLKKAIKFEEFEDAAHLRDKIRMLEARKKEKKDE